MSLWTPDFSSSEHLRRGGVAGSFALLTIFISCQTGSHIVHSELWTHYVTEGDLGLWDPPASASWVLPGMCHHIQCMQLGMEPKTPFVGAVNALHGWTITRPLFFKCIFVCVSVCVCACECIARRDQRQGIPLEPEFQVEPFNISARNRIYVLFKSSACN